MRLLHFLKEFFLRSFFIVPIMFATGATAHDLVVPALVPALVPATQVPYMQAPPLPIVRGGRTDRRRRRGSRQRRGGRRQKLQEHQGHVANRGGPSYFKVEMCKHYIQGRRCKYGRNCRFAHGTHELRPSVRSADPKFKSELCCFYHAINPKTGNIMAECRFDNRCLFVHEEQWALDRLHHQASIDNAITGDVLLHGPPDADSDFSDVDVFVSCGESSASSQYSESSVASPRGSVDWTEEETDLEDFGKENVPVSYMKQAIDHPVPFSQDNRSPMASSKNPHYLLNDPRVVWSLLQLSAGWCGYPRRACNTIW